MGSEIADIQSGLAKLSRISSLIRILAVIGIVIFGTAVLVSLFLLFRTWTQADSGCSAELILPLLSNLFTFFLGMGILGLLVLFFGVIANGESPFGNKCVMLIKAMSALFLLYALCEFLFPSAYFLIATGTDGLVTLVEQGYPLFRINLTALFSAVVFLALSFAFSYGMKLQELSDDTV